MIALDTTSLPDISQRQAPIENIGLVIGTCGTVPYIHLQLEMAKRFFGPGGLPILVVNDGATSDQSYDELDALCKQYGVDFYAGPYIGHSVGDIRVFIKGMEWAKENNIDVVAKFSRRFIPLEGMWRRELLTLTAKHREVAFFTRRQSDRTDGMFRTDAIAVRVRKLDNDKAKGLFEEAVKQPPGHLNVEPFMHSVSKFCGGWATWDLLGPEFYHPYEKAMHWRGLLPCHYGDLSRSLGLPYTDADFETSRQMVHDEELRPGKYDPPESTKLQAVNMGTGKEPQEKTIETLFAYLVRRYSEMHQHLPVLRALAHECETVTEFGVLGGMSSTAFLAAKPKVLRSYDIKFLPETVSRFNELKNGVQHDLIEEDTTKLHTIEETDLLLIDSLHTYRQVRMELRHHNRVNKYIVLHDTETFGAKGEDGSEPGIMAAVDEFLEANSRSWIRKFHLPNNNGLTVLERQHGRK